MEFTNIDNGGVDTITDVQRHTHFNFIIDIDKQSIMISRSIFHAPNIQCHVGAIKNGSNGSIFTEYDNLKYGIDIIRQKDKASIYSIHMMVQQHQINHVSRKYGSVVLLTVTT